MSINNRARLLSGVFSVVCISLLNLIRSLALRAARIFLRPVASPFCGGSAGSLASKRPEKKRSHQITIVFLIHAPRSSRRHFRVEAWPAVPDRASDYTPCTFACRCLGLRKHYRRSKGAPACRKPFASLDSYSSWLLRRTSGRVQPPTSFVWSPQCDVDLAGRASFSNVCLQTPFSPT